MIHLLIAATIWTAPDGRTVPQLIAAHVLPNPAMTPGVLNPAVTPATIKDTIGIHGWTAKVRPPVAYTNKLKVKDTPAGQKMADGELDHLISIEDGGSPTDPKNLWWMTYNDCYSARVKDVLETKLSHLIVAGKVPLAEAKSDLAVNWLISYQKYVGPLPACKGSHP